MLIWSANYIVAKSAISSVPPGGFNFLRLAVGAVALLVALRLHEGRFSIARRDLVALAGLASVGHTAYQVLWGTAIRTTTAGDSALIIGAAPALIALFAVALGADRITWTKGIGAVVALVGVALVVTAGTGLHLDAAGVGDLLTLGAAACWALYVVMGTPVFARVPAIASAAWAITFGAIWLAPFGLPDIIADPAAYARPEILLGAILSGLLAVAVAQVIVNHAIPLLGPMRYGNFQFLLPPLTVILGAIVLGERILPAQVAGGVVIAAGILIARRDARLVSFARFRRAG
jgi:drug/metabolite transporter (DMT)-like permease